VRREGRAGKGDLQQNPSGRFVRLVCIEGAMGKQPDFFRDFGILPQDISAPPKTVRARLPWGHVIAQYLATSLMSTLGIAIGIRLLFSADPPFPWNILASAVAFAGFGYFVCRATRNDYCWVELDGSKLRARHLYTQRVVERSIEEIDDLLTLVLKVRSLATYVVEAWLLGRVRGIMIRFRDQRTPFQVSRADPAMKNAKELIEAVVYRMSEIGEIDFDIVGFAGKPLIRRIYWKRASPTGE
jgi:hypothetical protein